MKSVPHISQRSAGSKCTIHYFSIHVKCVKRVHLPSSNMRVSGSDKCSAIYSPFIPDCPSTSRHVKVHEKERTLTTLASTLSMYGGPINALRTGVCVCVLLTRVRDLRSD